MICPWCGKEMTEGCISQDRYAIKWVAREKSKGILNFTPLVEGIKLTSFAENTVKVFYCKDCRKFVIDQEDMRI